MRTAFEPEVHGFHFPNSFSTTLLPSLGWGPLRTPPVALGGLCGGMTFAALDYYFAGWPVPTHVPGDYSPPGVPPNKSRLRDEIFRRHLNSVGLEPSANGIPVPGQSMRVKPADLHNLLTYPRLRVASTATLRTTLTTELQRAADALDAGRPVPIGLVAPGNLFSSHQVVAIGIDAGDATCILYLYDCRSPGVTATLTVTPAKPNCVLDAPGDASEPWRVFFVERYEPRTPAYADLVLEAPVTVVDGVARFDVRNAGDADAHAVAITLSGVDAPPEPVGVLAPGAAVHYEHPVSASGPAVYVDADGRTFPLPAG
ncbi:MAG TPA: hypothetical protein VH373_09020 [Jatrophihabitantaceae bacterium]|jgi:hypothetical protein